MAQINNFNFTVNFVPFKDNSKIQNLTVKKESGYKRLTMSVSDGKSNILLGIGKSEPKNGKIYVNLKDAETDKYKFTPINYEDRFNPEIIDNVNPFKKFVLDLGERKEFVYELDFIEAVYEAITQGLLDGKKLYISGEVERSRYNGKNNKNFVPNLIKYANEDAKLQLLGRQSFVFDKESLDTSMMKDEYKFELNGWVEYYSSQQKKNLMFPQTFVFDFSKAKTEENEDIKTAQLKIVEYMKSKFVVRKGYYEYGCDVSYLNGAEEEVLEFKELSKDLQMQIELGLTTLEQVQKENRAVGSRKQEVRLIKPDNRNYSEVFLRDDLDEESFIIQDLVEVKPMSDVAEVKQEVETETVEVTDDIFDSLFS